MKPAVVTGASGFLGRALATRLKADGREVIALLRDGSDDSKLRGIEVMRHDGTTGDLRRLLEKAGAETVFHLAAFVAGDARPEEDLEPLIRSNVLFGAQLAEACARTGAFKLVSAGTYYERRGGAGYDPVSLYAATKRAMNDLLEYYARATKVRAASLVLYDTYGPGDERPKLLNLLAQHAASGEPLKLSPGEQRLDLLHADDACSAFLAAEKALSSSSELGVHEWCASSGERVTLRQLVSLFEEATGLKVPAELGGKPYREREVMHPYQGPQVPGWKAEIPLKEGLRRVYGAKARA